MKRRAIRVLLLAAATAGLALSLSMGAESLAELVVTKIVLDPPSTIALGGPVDVTVGVMNTGTRDADGFNVSLFYRRQGDTGSWTEVPRPEKAEGTSLAASQDAAEEYLFILQTQGMDVGTYELRVVVDSTNLITEADELNNELRTVVTIVASANRLPDLQPVLLSFSPQNPGVIEGVLEPVVITTQIADVSTDAPNDSLNVTIQILIDGEVVATITDSMRRGEESNLLTYTVREQDHPTLAAGSHKVVVRVDPENVHAERDEQNNIIERTLTWIPYELFPESLRFSKATAYADEEIVLTAEIRNTGGVVKNPPDVEVAFFAGEVRFATAYAEDLHGGKTGVVTATLNPMLAKLDAPDVYDIRVVVDPANLLDETNEENNVIVRSLSVEPAREKKPELHPETFELSPASPRELGKVDTVCLSSVIKNTGLADAAGFSASFAYRRKGELKWNEIDDGGNLADLILHSGDETKLSVCLPLQASAVHPALDAGIYEMRVLVDSESAIDELDDGNNELVTTLTLLASRRPDLMISITSVDPSGAVNKGQTARVTATVTNAGQQASPASSVEFGYCELTAGATPQAACLGDFLTRAILPDAILPVPPLEIGESATVQVNLETAHLTGAGQYRIEAVVDPDNAIAERDEMIGPAVNNAAAVNLLVLGPDLLPVAGSLQSVPSGTIDQDEVDEVAFSATIQNQGPVAAGQFFVTFELLKVVAGALEPVALRSCHDVGFDCTGLPYFGMVEVPGIGAGAELAVSCTLDLAEQDLDEGQYVARLYVDRLSLEETGDIDAGLVSEHNELNNSTELILTIIGDGEEDENGNGGPPPGQFPEGVDLAVDVVNGRASVTAEGVTAYGVIRNLGIVNSGPFTVRISVTLPSGVTCSQEVQTVSDPGLEAGDQMTIGVRFARGADFREALATGDMVMAKAEILGEDDDLTNNVGMRLFTVKD